MHILTQRAFCGPWPSWHRKNHNTGGGGQAGWSLFNFTLLIHQKPVSVFRCISFQAVRGGEKVLVCAPSNVAVDNLLERLHSHRYMLLICLTLNIMATTWLPV